MIHLLATGRIKEERYAFEGLHVIYRLISFHNYYLQISRKDEIMINLSMNIFECVIVFFSIPYLLCIEKS